MKRRWVRVIMIVLALALLLILAACSPEDAREKGRQAGEALGNLLDGFFEGFCNSTGALILIVVTFTAAVLRRTFIDR